MPPLLEHEKVLLPIHDRLFEFPRAPRACLPTPLFLVGDRGATRADTLVTVGAIQSNHVRQTATAAVRAGMSCALLLKTFVPRSDEFYERAGNVLLAHPLGAELHFARGPSRIGDEARLDQLVVELRSQGRPPIPGALGGSRHRLGGSGTWAALSSWPTSGSNSM